MGRRKALCALVLTLAIPASAQDAMERDFKRAFEAQNEKALEEACKAIVKVGLPDGAKLILSGLGRPQIEPDIYWILVRAAAAFQNSNALELVAKT
ncbi:MAG: hypothetical protein HYY16_11525, partial [Planctomycetes bacterium]|nr:hypothetical protein [Planctomycetota bacterium]